MTIHECAASAPHKGLSALFDYAWWHHMQQGLLLYCCRSKAWCRCICLLVWCRAVRF